MKRLQNFRIIPYFIFVFSLLFSANSFAVGGNYTSDVDLEPVLAMLEDGQYEQAIDFLHTELDYDPDNADIMALLGYSYRKTRNYDDAKTFYEWALKAAPEHRGANEYLGELYLETNQMSKAIEQLNKLESLCSRNCDEYSLLKTAIDSFQASGS